MYILEFELHTGVNELQKRIPGCYFSVLIVVKVFKIMDFFT